MEMQIKTTLRFHLLSVRMVKIKSHVTAHVGEDAEEKEHSSIGGGIENRYNHSGINLYILLKTENRSTWRFSFTSIGHVPKSCSAGATQGHVIHYIHSSLICDRQNLETTQISHNGRMDTKNMACLHNYSVIKNEDIMSYVGKWRKLENIILSEVTQIPKNMNVIDSLISGY